MPGTTLIPRSARPRHYLLCPPRHFEVSYSINAWMDPGRPVDTTRAMVQWQELADTLLNLGHKVDLVDPVPGLPDMVFAANAATVIDGQALVARFRNPERTGETEPYLEWFRSHGFPDAIVATMVNEGEGDLLVTDERILAGHGFRTEDGAHSEVQRYFGRPVVSLELVDPRFYHLDTALAVLDEQSGEIMYYPSAFSQRSQETLAELYPDAILATEDDAIVLGLNAVSDGHNALLPTAATSLAARVRERGFRVTTLDLSEFLKSGGGIKCCTLEIRGS
jgi:N-dimethylarginine dimethylaminohydrolase